MGNSNNSITGRCFIHHKHSKSDSGHKYYTNFCFRQLSNTKYILYSKLLVKASITSKEGFNFFLSSGYFSIINKFQDIQEIEKIQYIKKALKKYDLYLKQECGLKMIKHDIILTKIIGEKSDNMNISIIKLKDALDGKELDFLREVTDMCKNEKIQILEQKKFTFPINHSFTIIGIISSAIYYTVTSIPQILQLISEKSP